MEFRQLRHFVAVADEKNFTAAARRVHISQPALTRSIKTLEGSLKSQLFMRGPRGASLTKAGDRFYERAQLILSDCARAEEDLVTLRDGVEGCVCFGIAAMFSCWIADDVVDRVGRELPGVQLAVGEGYYEDLVAKLRLGQIDFALSNLPPVAVEAGLVAEPLIQLEPRVVSGLKHPLARRRRLRVSDLVDARWVIVDRPHSLQSFRQLFLDHGVSAPPVTVTDSLGLIRSLVVRGSHVSLIVEPVVHRELRRGTVKILQVQTPPLTRRAGILAVDRPVHRAVVTRVMDIVRERIWQERDT